MKKVFLALTAIVMSMSAFAQEEAGKEKMAVNEFTYNENVGAEFGSAVRNKVLEGIGAMARFDFVDKSAQDVDYKYLLDGQVISITISSRQTDDGKTYYDAKVAYSLKVSEKEGSEHTMVANETFEVGSSSLTSMHTTKVDAFNAAIDKINDNIKKFIDENFKLKGGLFSVEEIKKDEAKTCYISLGSLKGIQKGQKFDVMVQKTVGKRKVNKVIGEIQVEAVEGDDASLCKVKKGGKEILAAFRELEEGQELPVVSKVDNGGLMKSAKGFIGF